MVRHMGPIRLPNAVGGWLGWLEVGWLGGLWVDGGWSWVGVGWWLGGLVVVWLGGSGVGEWLGWLGGLGGLGVGGVSSPHMNPYGASVPDGGLWAYMAYRDQGTFTSDQ